MLVTKSINVIGRGGEVEKVVDVSVSVPEASGQSLILNLYILPYFPAGGNHQ